MSIEADQYTLSEQMMPVSDDHAIYLQLWGDETASNTAIFLHGGPGSGCSEASKAFFNPEQHRVIFMDQRGTGRSVPSGSIVGNTTNELVSDITTALDFYDVDKAVLVGRSWGSTLALKYAIENSNRVKNMVVGGVLLGSQAEIDYVDQGEFRWHLPDVWEAYEDTVPEANRSNPTKYHADRILSDDPEAARQSAYIYDQMEGAASNIEAVEFGEPPADYDPNPTIIATHYLQNGLFLAEDEILNNLDAIDGIPMRVIQGRIDFVTPPAAAYRLSEVLDLSKIVYTMAGHGQKEPANVEATRLAVNEMMSR